MRDFKQTLEWYDTHRTARELGFNPDGMCLKICRTARGIPAVYGTAKAAQDATPSSKRVFRVRDLRRGMILYFDDPADSNKAGHVASMRGRVKGFDPDSLHDVLLETNSVKKGELVVVRGTYFMQHWGDPFQFGAKWLNGFDLDYPSGQSRVAKFKDGGPQWHVGFLDAAVNAGRKGIKPIRDGIDAAVKALPNDDKDTRVRQFKEEYARTRILRMGLLNAAVTQGGREGSVKTQRDRIRALIRSLPPG